MTILKSSGYVFAVFVLLSFLANSNKAEEDSPLKSCDTFVCRLFKGKVCCEGQLYRDTCHLYEEACRQGMEITQMCPKGIQDLPKGHEECNQSYPPRVVIMDARF